jgi:hypothetical protein
MLPVSVTVAGGDGAAAGGTCVEYTLADYRLVSLAAPELLHETPTACEPANRSAGVVVVGTSIAVQNRCAKQLCPRWSTLTAD